VETKLHLELHLPALYAVSRSYASSPSLFTSSLSIFPIIISIVIAFLAFHFNTFALTTKASNLTNFILETILSADLTVEKSVGETNIVSRKPPALANKPNSLKMLSVLTFVAVYASTIGFAAAQSIDPSSVSKGTRSEYIPSTSLTSCR
jgi:hypothetical protein